MKAILLTGHGGPEKLQLDAEYPVPDIAPDEVLIKVGACGINNTDIWVREGAYGSTDDPDEVASFGESPLQFPLVQGADIAGVVVATGANIKPSRKYERVMVDFGIYAGTGEDVPSHDYIGSGRPGGFAEYVAVPAENAHAIETRLTDAELATFCCAYEAQAAQFSTIQTHFSHRFLPRRGFPRPTPEWVFVVDHQSGSRFSGTSFLGRQPRPI